jgi:RNA polymerase sigma-70 factor (ECF subfamily)
MADDQSRIDRAAAFEQFFRAHYRTLLAQARYAGAEKSDAEDAVADAMLDVYASWHRLEEPLAWARKAVVRYFLKGKNRHLDRIRVRQVERGAGTPPARTDANLTSWEEWQEIKDLLLGLLTPGQRKVMALVFDGYGPTEIAGMFAVRPEAVRQQLCAARAVLVAAWRREQQHVEPRGRS